MEAALKEIIEQLKASEAEPTQRWLDQLLRRRSSEARKGAQRLAKKQLWPFYLRLKADHPEDWAALGVDGSLEARLGRLLRTKPRRTASGVATLTVITKPHPCAGDCLYCPSDVRMPKSYLSDEPACQRAERCWFDPYLQVVARLRALRAMGHPTDKVELIVLGGTWSDYPAPYRRWFVTELFRGLNDGAAVVEAPLPGELEREAAYQRWGLLREPLELAAQAAAFQGRVDAGVLGYSEAVSQLYGTSGWVEAASSQQASWEDVEAQHAANEQAACRCVGLVVETRPELVTPEALIDLRRLGCTKVQMGIQSLDERILMLNGRPFGLATIARAFRLLRAFGFKTHVHLMANLKGSTLEADLASYARLMSDPAFLPDEVKLYPCALVASSRLMEAWRSGEWAPYSEDELVSLLAEALRLTPGYARVSRVIRDISAGDIVVGNKKANLRQMVEARLEAKDVALREIRSREIATDGVQAAELRLDEMAYLAAGTAERFLQWVTPDGRIAGFLRLSLPDRAVEQEVLSPASAKEAMIREVHVYGAAERLSGRGQLHEGAQHQGLGRKLVDRACVIAAEEGYGAINVISAVGTRAYYRRLGFADAGLYQRKEL